MPARLTLGVAVGCLCLVATACTSGGTPTAAALEEFTVTAPVDCLTNAYCGRGLADTYGVDIAQGLQRSRRISASVQALKRGSTDLAVVFSNSPYPRDPSLVALKDDRGMLAAENVVPVYRRSLKVLYPALPRDLQRLGALVTTKALRTLDRGIANGKTPEQAAARWLSLTAPSSSVRSKPGPRLTIGAADFLENQALAHVVAGYLADRGYRTRVKVLPGNRPAVVDALANAQIDITPEYAASMLEYLNGFRGEATADTTATVRRLATYLDLIGAVPAGAAPGQSTNVFLTTKKLADTLHLRSLSDLQKTTLPRVTPVPAKPVTGPVQLGILVRAVGHQLSVGSTGPEVRDLQRRLRQLRYAVAVTAMFDQATVRAVRAFQGSQGLAPNGVVGPVTEAALAAPKASTDPNPVLPGDGSAVDPKSTTRTGGKVIYLTFDDGPAVTYTKQILALLKKYDAKATFFQLGQNSTAHRDLTAAVLAQGHALASHTWDHADMTKLSTTALTHEIDETTRALSKAKGGPITCLRPPYGAVNDRVRAAVAGRKLALHLWDIDPQDWSRPGVNAIVSNVLAGAHPGAVSLMHDGGGDRSQSVAALAKILPTLAARGYRFASLPGC